MPGFHYTSDRCWAAVSFLGTRERKVERYGGSQNTSKRGQNRFRETFVTITLRAEYRHSGFFSYADISDLSFV